MGWIAAGCCTIIAGFILYRFLPKDVAIDGEKVEPKSQDDHTSALLEKAAENIQPSMKATLQNSTTEPTLKISLASMEDSQPNGGPVKEVVEQSAQKVNGASQIMPPPPPPKLNRSSSPPRLKPASLAAPPRPGNGFVRPPPSAAASLRVPVTKVLPNASLAPTSSIMPPGKQVSRKVMLEPGHSPLDWAALTNNPSSRLRGKDAPGENFLRITPAQLRKQNGRKGRDAWTVYQGKVYNITPYVPFHPGGAGEILRGAAKDSVKLFMEVHPWVNWDGMLSECLVGILVSEEEASGKNGSLDEMD